MEGLYESREGCDGKMKLKNIVLGLGIVIVYALVLWQGTQAFYPPPEWDDFCDFNPRVPLKRFDDRVDCSFNQEVNDKGIACEREKGFFVEEYDENGCVIDGFCDDECKKPDTEIISEKGIKFKHCLACGAKYPIKSKI